MPELKQPDKTPIPPTELVRQLNEIQGWLVDKGEWCNYANVHGMQANARLTQSGVVLDIVGENRAANVLIRPTDRVFFGNYPYLIQIWRTTDRPTQRKNEEGGGMHLAPQDTLMISFRSELLMAWTKDEMRYRATHSYPLRSDTSYLSEARRPRVSVRSTEYPDLRIVRGPTRDEIKGALAAFVSWPRVAKPMLRFTMANGKTYEGHLTGLPYSPRGQVVHLSIDCMPDSIEYIPETGSGSMFEDF